MRIQLALLHLPGQGRCAFGASTFSVGAPLLSRSQHRRRCVPWMRQVQECPAQNKSEARGRPLAGEVPGTIGPMPNIAALLKGEIARVARKEVRAETQFLKKAVGTHRSEIAELKRRVQALEKELRRVAKAAQNAAPPVGSVEEQRPALRFSAKGFASQRKRLGLSAADCGLLVGASGLSVYKWESSQSRPRTKFLPAIAALRTLGKKDAAAKLEALR